MQVKRKLPWAVALLVVLALAIVATGCGGSDEKSQPSGDTGGAADTSSGASTSEAAPMKIGLVTDTGGVNDRGFNQFSIEGLKQAASELGVETRVFISKSSDDYLPNLQAAAEDDSDLVVAVGFLLGPSVAKAAQAFPDVKFAGVDQFFGTPDTGCEDTSTCAQPNVEGLIYPTEEAGYLAGIVAAMVTKSGTVSAVGGKKIPPVDNWIAGYEQAIIDTKPSVKILKVSYSQDFVDQAKCKEIALDQIAQGSDVLFQVAGQCGLGVLDAAGEKKVFAIGVDADQSFAGPQVITSALKPLQASVFETIKEFQAGQLEFGSNKSFGIQDVPDAELLAPFTDEVPQEVQDAVAAAKEKLASGDIDPPATLEEVK